MLVLGLADTLYLLHSKVISHQSSGTAALECCKV